jgi:hypothetical protein
MRTPFTVALCNSLHSSRMQVGPLQKLGIKQLFSASVVANAAILWRAGTQYAHMTAVCFARIDLFPHGRVAQRRSHQQRPELPIGLRLLLAYAPFTCNVDRQSAWVMAYRLSSGWSESESESDPHCDLSIRFMQTIYKNGLQKLPDHAHILLGCRDARRSSCSHFRGAHAHNQHRMPTRPLSTLHARAWYVAILKICTSSTSTCVTAPG